MADKDYSNLARDIIEHTGGATNIIDLSHCATRLRFQLKNSEKADTEYLRDLDDVITVIEAGGQYQIVIGPHVADVYDAVLAQGISEEGLQEDSIERAGKRNLLEVFIDVISGIFQPFLGTLAAVGILKGIASLLTVVLGWNTSNNGVFMIINIMGDGLFQFLPIVLAITAARKFRVNEFTALAIASALVYPNLATIVATLGENNAAYFFGLPIQLPPGGGGYLMTVTPIILSIWLTSYVERWIKSWMPDVIKTFMVPFLTLLIIVPVTILAVGPLANASSEAIASALTVIRQFSPLVYGLAIGTVWQVLVMFGLHWGLVPLAILELTQTGTMEILMPVQIINFAQTGVLLAILMKTKEQKVRTIGIPALVTTLFGGIEPALYGIVLPMKIPFYITCGVGGVVAAIVSVMGAKAYVFGAQGIFQYPAYINPETGSMYDVGVMLAATAVAILLSFVIQLILPVPKIFDKENFDKEKNYKEIVAELTEL